MTPKAILEAIKELVAKSGDSSERFDQLDLKGKLDKDRFERWTVIARDGEDLGLTVTMRAGGDPIAATDFAQTPEIDADVTIEKPSTPTTFYFFTIKGLETLLGDDDFASRARRVLTAEQESPFAAMSCRFEPWVARVDDERAPDPLPEALPRKLVHDLVGKRVPASIGSSLLAPESQDDGSRAMRVWRASAVVRLRAALANGISKIDGVEVVTLEGARTVMVDVESDGVSSVPLFAQVNKAGHWVYATGRDVGPRFLIFTHELAREWQPDRLWYDGFAEFAARALVSAENVYQKHLDTVSNETIKALSDLRKTLNDEIIKVTQQTRDLGAGLWRDFAIALAAIVARVGFLVTGTADSGPVVLVMYGVATYLAVTLGVSLYGNWRFGVIAAESRAEWNNRLYGFLTKKDLEVLAKRPLQQANGIYRATACAVTIGYIVMIAALIANATLVHATRQQQSAATTQQAKPTPSRVHH